jgi:Ca-activated chloride channel family protein
MNFSFFQYPFALLGLLLIPFILLFRLIQNHQNNLIYSDYLSPNLLKSFKSNHNPYKEPLIFYFYLLSFSLAVIAVARPQWGEIQTERTSKGRCIILAIDTSRSMLARDTSPDRLTRTKLASFDLLKRLGNDNVGVIAFAGEAYLSAPLTNDVEALHETIDSLNVNSIPLGGTRINKAIDLATETFSRSKINNYGLILFSDGGESNPALAKSIENALKQRIMVVTVGVGTPQGDLIPDPNPEREGEFLRNDQDEIIKTKLEPTTLQQIAKGTRGTYLPLNNDSASALIDQTLSSLAQQELASRTKTTKIERYQIPLSLSLFFFLLAWFINTSFRKITRFRLSPMTSASTLSLYFLVALIHSTPYLLAIDSNQNTHTPTTLDRPISQVPENLSSSEKEALQLLNNKQPQEAEKKFRELLESPTLTPKQYSQYSYGLGSTLYEQKRYNDATIAYSQSLQTPKVPTQLQLDSHQAIAHSLYNQGELLINQKKREKAIKSWRDAIKHLNTYLKQNPEHTKIKANRDFIIKRIKELQEQMQQDKQNKNKQKGQGKPQNPNGHDQGEDEDEENEGSAPIEREQGEGSTKDLKGDIKPGDEGEAEEPEESQESENNQRNSDTGYTEEEARRHLDNLNNNQQNRQNKREPKNPPDGKNY